MPLTPEQKQLLAELVREKKAILFGKFSPEVTKVVKRKNWDAIYNQLIAHGAIIPDVNQLRRVS